MGNPVQTRHVERGSALLLAMFLLAVLGAGVAALAPVALTERLLASVARETAECRFAAGAAAAYAMAELQARGDWSGVLDGTDAAGFVDATRQPTVGGSRREDLDEITAGLSASRLGDWGPDHPRWTLFAWGPARGLAPAALTTRVYVAAWLADDEGDGDHDPSRDTNGRLTIAARAFGPVRGTCTVVAAVKRERPWPAALRVMDWRVGS